MQLNLFLYLQPLNKNRVYRSEGPLSKVYFFGYGEVAQVVRAQDS